MREGNEDEAATNGQGGDTAAPTDTDEQLTTEPGLEASDELALDPVSESVDAPADEPVVATSDDAATEPALASPGDPILEASAAEPADDASGDTVHPTSDEPALEAFTEPTIDALAMPAERAAEHQLGDDGAAEPAAPLGAAELVVDASDEVESPDETAPTDVDERLVGIIESVLFACAEPITLVRLSEVVAGPTRSELRAALAALATRAEQDRRGIRLIEVAGGYQFRTAPEHAEWVRRLFQQRPWRLTRATLETLAIVAYKQPITRAEVEAIRGVDVDSVLASLLARKLVKIVGRKEVIGRPLLYGTTRQFLEVFGLRDLAALPGLTEVAAAMPESVGAGAAGGSEETWSGDDRQDEGHTPTEAAGGRGDLLATSGGDDDRERTGDRERQNGQDPGDPSTSD